MNPSGVYAENHGGHFYYAIRYRSDTDLGRRFPKPARGRFKTRADAEQIRSVCPNAESMEVVDVRET